MPELNAKNLITFMLSGFFFDWNKRLSKRLRVKNILIIRQLIYYAFLFFETRLPPDIFRCQADT